MRYITDENGYLREVSFGAEIDCDDGICTEYTGTVPAAYESIEDWYIFNADRLYQWQIVDGNLVEDGSLPEPEDCLVIPIERGGTGADTVAGARAALGLGDTDGPLPIECGGTGADTAEGARAALGLGETTGPLPIECGGTGADTVEGARKALGLGETAGALPVECGGTGVTTVEDLRSLLGIDDISSSTAVFG